MTMSAKISGMVWDLKLSPAERQVLLAMADHADHEGNNVRPSVALIAWKTDYSERQVQRIIKDLRKAGILVLTKGATPHSPNHYRIDVSAGIFKEPFRSEKRQDVTPPDARGDKMSPLFRGDILSPGDIAMSPGGVTQLCHPRGDIAMSPDPSYNHHDNRQESVAPPARAPRKARTRTPTKETKDDEAPTPIAVIQALAEVCVIDRSLVAKKDHIVLASAAKALYQAGQRNGKSDAEIIETIKGFDPWFKQHDFRGQKGEAPTPDLVRRLWAQYIQTKHGRPANPRAPLYRSINDVLGSEK